MKTHITILCCLCCWLGFGQSITEVEYFFNSDPGFGNATSLTVNSNTGELTQNYNIATPTDATGFNVLYVRAKDNNNIWSLYSNAIFYITDTEASTVATEITAAEYFINTDPGFGNANSITVNPNSGNLTQNFNIPIGSNLSGFNSLYVRTQDDLDQWSLYDTVKFYILEDQGSGATNISAMEYFFDTDPGFGNANSISLNANTGSITENVVLSLGSLDVGFHNLYIRAQDDLGVWSIYDKRTFYVTPVQAVSPIAGAEYFYDSDPGFGNGTAVALTPTGNLDEFIIDLSTVDVTCDFHDFYIRLINEDGTWSLYDYGLEIEVFDNADPTIVVYDNITVELDVNGEASIDINDVDNGTFDDCELVSVVLNQAQFDYTCADLGTNTVTITATDAEAKVSTQDVTITVADNIDPVAVAQNISVNLDANGTASFTADDLENGSTDNCSIVSRSVDITTFDCSNLGPNTVNYTVTDADGNSNTVSAVVTVIDNTIPTATTQNITVSLDTNGTTSVVPDDIDLSTDNCTIVSKSLDITSFDCSNLGDNIVTLTVTDQSGNSNSATATITVEDPIAPTVITQNITVQLNEFGIISIEASDIENGSSDNCTISSSSLDVTSFNCDDLGDNTVTLSVTDQSNNTGTATAVVTVVDVTNPTAVAQNITVELDASGNASIIASEVDNGSADNCSIDTRSLDISSFDCTMIGSNTVTLTVTDISSNSNSTTAVVMVEDNIAPTVSTQNITVQLDANGNATISETDIENNVTDNCGIASSVLDTNSFDCNDLGANTVTLTVTDSNGNVTSTPATVTIEDNINPLAVTQNITLQLDANGDASIATTDIDNGSSDNCEIASSSLDKSSFNCNDLGVNNVILTVTDSSGNTHTASATVTVEDVSNPVAIGQDITVNLNGNDSVTITANDVDNGSSDNCSNYILSIDEDTFTSPGVYPVILTITDSSGNTDNVTVNVTVEDTVLGIEEQEINKNDIKLFPNPVDMLLNVKTKLQIEHIKIFDINGKEVLNINHYKDQINVSNLSEGVYFVKFYASGSTFTKQFIKQ